MWWRMTEFPIESWPSSASRPEQGLTNAQLAFGRTVQVEAFTSLMGQVNLPPWREKIGIISVLIMKSSLILHLFHGAAALECDWCLFALWNSCGSRNRLQFPSLKVTTVQQISTHRM